MVKNNTLKSALKIGKLLVQLKKIAPVNVNFFTNPEKRILRQFALKRWVKTRSSIINKKKKTVIVLTDKGKRKARAFKNL